jgi:hypothetical protein
MIFPPLSNRDNEALDDMERRTARVNWNRAVEEACSILELRARECDCWLGGEERAKALREAAAEIADLKR